MSPKKIKLQLSLSFFHIFLLFLESTLTNREVPRGGLWQWRTGVADVPFQHLPYGNAAHTTFHSSSSLNSLLHVRRQLDVKINLTHWQSVKERKLKHCVCPKTWTNPCQETRMSCSENTLFISDHNSLCISWTAHGSPFFPFLQAWRNWDFLSTVSPGFGRTSHKKKPISQLKSLIWGFLACIRFCSVWVGVVMLPNWASLGG